MLRFTPFKLNTRTKIRLARLSYRLIHGLRRLAGLSDQVAVERHGIRWKLDLREGIDLAIYLFGYFERKTVRAYSRILKPGDTVLDIGANIGAHTLPFAERVAPHGRVIAFEPTSFAFAKLRANIASNPRLGRLICAEQMMLAAEGDATLPPLIYSSWPLLRTGEVPHPKHQGVMRETTGARVLSLDGYIAEAGTPRVDFIKLDVDGREYDVLRGTLQTLRRDRPVILMEIMPYGLEECGASLEQLLSLLNSLGYYLFGLGGTPLPSDASLAILTPPDGGINVVCRCP